jgi:hypothetical protein
MTLPFLPNHTDATIPEQADPDAVDFGQLISAIGGTGIIVGGAVTEDPVTPAMTVDVTAPSLIYSGSLIQVAAETDVAVAAADATYLRIDLVSVDTFGNQIAVTTGTPANVPVCPDVPADHLPLAMIYVPVGTTAITDGLIVDKRIPIAPIRRAYQMWPSGDFAFWDTNTNDVITLTIWDETAGSIKTLLAFYGPNHATLAGNVDLFNGAGDTLIATWDEATGRFNLVQPVRLSDPLDVNGNDIDMGGGSILDSAPVASVSGTVNIDATTPPILVFDTSGGAGVANLPSAVTFTGRSWLIIADGANDVTVNRNGSDTFQGGATSKTVTGDETPRAGLGVMSIGGTEWKWIPSGTVT